MSAPVNQDVKGLFDKVTASYQQFFAVPATVGDFVHDFEIGINTAFDATGGFQKSMNAQDVRQTLHEWMALNISGTDTDNIQDTALLPLSLEQGKIARYLLGTIKPTNNMSLDQFSRILKARPKGQTVKKLGKRANRPPLPRKPRSVLSTKQIASLPPPSVLPTDIQRRLQTLMAPENPCDALLRKVIESYVGHFRPPQTLVDFIHDEETGVSSAFRFRIPKVDPLTASPREIQTVLDEWRALNISDEETDDISETSLAPLTIAEAELAQMLIRTTTDDDERGLDCVEIMRDIASEVRVETSVAALEEMLPADLTTLPLAVYTLIAEYLSTRDIQALCVSASRLAQVCNNVEFWRAVWATEFPEQTLPTGNAAALRLKFLSKTLRNEAKVTVDLYAEDEDIAKILEENPGLLEGDLIITYFTGPIGYYVTITDEGTRTLIPFKTTLPPQAFDLVEANNYAMDYWTKPVEHLNREIRTRPANVGKKSYEIPQIYKPTTVVIPRTKYRAEEQKYRKLHAATYPAVANPNYYNKVTLRNGTRIQGDEDNLEFWKDIGVRTGITSMLEEDPIYLIAKYMLKKDPEFDTKTRGTFLLKAILLGVVRSAKDARYMIGDVDGFDKFLKGWINQYGNRYPWMTLIHDVWEKLGVPTTYKVDTEPIAGAFRAYDAKDGQENQESIAGSIRFYINKVLKRHKLPLVSQEQVLDIVSTWPTRDEVVKQWSQEFDM